MIGGMYGGGLGMGSGMYGGGLGMGSGMYGGGLGMGSGMYGGGLGMGSGMYGSSTGMGTGRMYSTNLSGMSGDTTFGGRQGQSSIAAGSVGGPSVSGGDPGTLKELLLTNGEQSASPINQAAAPLPPLNESPKERRRRIVLARRQQRQLIVQQRNQQRQLRLQARMEIAGHLTNILIQTLRSAMELFAVCSGAYYSMKAVRSFTSSQEILAQQQQRGVAVQTIAGGTASQSLPVASQSVKTITNRSGLRSWRSWLLLGAIFLLGEVLSRYAGRLHGSKHDRGDRRSSLLTSGEETDTVSLDEYEDCSGCSEDDRSLLSSATDSGETRGTYTIVDSADFASPGPSHRHVYVAVYDYEAPHDGGYIQFKAGDEFVIDNFVEDGWCEAVNFGEGSAEGKGTRGLVPGNFLRRLERTTKL